MGVNNVNLINGDGEQMLPTTHVDFVYLSDNVTTLGGIITKSGSTWLFGGKADSATKDGNGNVITDRYVTLGTIQTLSGAKTFSNGLILGNGANLRVKDSASANKGVLTMDGNNVLKIGYETATAGYDTTLHGNTIKMHIGTSHAEAVSIGASGMSVTGDISASRGMSALGIADLSVSAGNGGQGTMTGIQMGSTLLSPDDQGVVSMTSASAVSGGTEPTLVTTGEKYLWNTKPQFSEWDSIDNHPDLRYRTIGKMVCFKGRTATLNFESGQSYITIGTMPVGYRPLDNVVITKPSNSFNSSTGAVWTIEILQSGVVRVLPLRYNGGAIQAAQSVSVIFDNIFYFVD